MSFFQKSFFLPVAALFLILAGQAPSVLAAPGAVMTLDWDDLIPPKQVSLMEDDEKDLQTRLDDLHASAPQQRLSEAAPYGEKETVAGFTQKIEGYSAVGDLDGRMVKIPGFMVPLEYGSPGMMRDFLLVPYFGACVHVPPPPPNQIILVEPDHEIDMAVVWGAVWVTGTLEVTRSDTEYAQTLYSLKLDRIDLYEEDW